MKKKEKITHGWHFLRKTKKLAYKHDERAVQEGVWYTAMSRYGGSPEQKPTLCNFGMHASKNISRAFDYHPGMYNRDNHHYEGLWCCRVAVRGDIDKVYDKFCGLGRKILWWVFIPYKVICSIEKSAGLEQRRIRLLQEVKVRYEKAYKKPFKNTQVTKMKEVLNYRPKKKKRAK